jgi:hypothetical protein
MAILHFPERVVAVTKRPRREISGRGCFAIATTRSGFFAHYAFLHFERNTYTNNCTISDSFIVTFGRTPKCWLFTVPLLVYSIRLCNLLSKYFIHYR